MYEAILMSVAAVHDKIVREIFYAGSLLVSEANRIFPRVHACMHVRERGGKIQLTYHSVSATSKM